MSERRSSSSRAAAGPNPCKIGGMAIEVVPATGDLLERILDDTFPIWGEGLDRAAYARYNRAQLATPWGATHLRRVALVDERPAARHREALRSERAPRRAADQDPRPRRRVHPGGRARPRPRRHPAAAADGRRGGRGLRAGAALLGHRPALLRASRLPPASRQPGGAVGPARDAQGHAHDPHAVRRLRRSAPLSSR